MSTNPDPNGMSNLPSDILIDILSRLPIKTIFDSRCVSKTWLDLISTPEFIKLHLSRSPPTLIINRLQSDHHYNLLKFFPLVDLQNNQDIHYIQPIISEYTTISSITDNKVLHGSANGLLLLSNLANDDCYICNPITREYIVLPEVLDIGMNPNAVIAHGFGYDSVNDEYKVVRINQEHTFDDETELLTQCDTDIEVYTLGSSSWRRVNYCRYYFGCHFHGNGIQVNNQLHWLIFDPRQGDQWILGIDLNDESSQLITVPPRMNIQTSTLGELNGRLCVFNNVKDTETEVWVFEEHGDEMIWAKRVEMQDSRGLGFANKRVRVLTILDDDETLLFEWNNYCLFSMHPERTDLEIYDLCEPGIQARVGVLSFLSLKNFEKQDSEDSDDDSEYLEKVKKF